jgi:hypothetical protein
LGPASAAATINPNTTRRNDFLRMEHRFKRGSDTWQAFPAKKSEIFAIFAKRAMTILLSQGL